MRVILSAVFLFYLLSITACTSALNKDKNDNQALEKEIIEKADKLFKAGKYNEGVSLLRSYLNKFPHSQYSDDAAYRLAYVCVIDDKNNAYFNYKNAESGFRAVLEKYPETNYFSACKNWIKILNLYNNKVSALRSGTAGKSRNLSGTHKALLKENKALKKENERLKKTLSELEEALQR